MPSVLDENHFRETFLRNRWVQWFFISVLVIILFRVGYLQLVRGSELFQFSQNNQIRKEYIPALRGLIYDRHNTILADHRFRFDVVWIPQYVKDKIQTAQFLAQHLALSAEDILQKVKKFQGRPRFLPIVIAEDVSEEVIATLESQKKFYDGIDLQVEPVRLYPYQDLLAHVLGYVSQVNTQELRALSDRQYRVGDLIGKKGIELVGESYLRGVAGVHLIQVDAHGRQVEEEKQFAPLLWHRLQRQDSVQGKHLKITVDLNLQKAMVAAFQGQPGAGVVLDIHSGEVLALASLPSYDPNQINDQFHEIIQQPGYPLLNKTIQGTFSPGSTFKILTALAALKFGVIKPQEKISCNGSYVFGRHRYHCWKEGGHGVVDLNDAIAQSCDVYFYHVAQRLDVDWVARFVKAMGLGQILGIELFHERSGIVPTREWKEKRFGEPWQGGETLSLAIGQGFLTHTPLQLATAFAAVLNGGRVYKPYLVDQVLDGEGQVLYDIQPTVLREIRLNPEHLSFVRNAMVGVMESPRGTGFYQRSRRVRFGGKTGTAQVRRFSKTELYQKCEQLPFQQRHHGLFVGFWPIEEPKWVAVVVREHACHGASAAIPVVRAIFEAAIQGVTQPPPEPKMAKANP